jgi:hypothetical protein
VTTTTGPTPTPSPTPTATPSPSPSPSATTTPTVAPRVETKQVEALGVLLTVPKDWRVVVSNDSHEACVSAGGSAGDDADDCSGVSVLASGDYVETAYKREVCPGKRVGGPTQVKLERAIAWHSEYGAGCRVRHEWWLDGFWSVRTHTPQLTDIQQAAVNSASIAPTPGGAAGKPFDVDGDGQRDVVRTRLVGKEVRVTAALATGEEISGRLTYDARVASLIGVLDLDWDGKAEILVRVEMGANTEWIAVFRQDGSQPRLVALHSGASAKRDPFLLYLGGGIEAPWAGAAT